LDKKNGYLSRATFTSRGGEEKNCAAAFRKLPMFHQRHKVPSPLITPIKEAKNANQPEENIEFLQRFSVIRLTQVEKFMKQKREAFKNENITGA
jgi:hypothetical protein